MKNAFANAAKGSLKWVAAVVLSIIGKIGTGLIPLVTFLKVLHFDSITWMFVALIGSVVAAACFYLLIKAIINKILTGVFTPMNVIVGEDNK